MYQAALEVYQAYLDTQPLDVICEEANPTKTTCVLDIPSDYTVNITTIDETPTTTMTTIEEVCASLGGIYLESSLIWQCTSDDDQQHQTFYTLNGSPQCYASQVCSVLEYNVLEEDRTLQLQQELETLLTTSTCRQVRWTISDPMDYSTTNADNPTPSSPKELCLERTLQLQQVLAVHSSNVVEQQTALLETAVSNCGEDDACLADFQSIDFQDTCEEDLKGIYVALDFTSECTTTTSDAAATTTRRMTIQNYPLCVSGDYCGTTSLLEAAAQDAASQLSWVDDTTTTTSNDSPLSSCIVSNLQIQDFGPTVAPTTSPAPTLAAPPTLSPAPSEAGSCLEDSILLNTTTTSWQDALMTAASYQLEFYAIIESTNTSEEGSSSSTSTELMCDFSTPSNNPNKNARGLATRLRRSSTTSTRHLAPVEDSTCQAWKYGLAAQDNIFDEDSSTASRPARTACIDQGGLYVEAIYNLECTDPSQALHQTTLWNQPHCLASKCQMDMRQAQETILKLNEWRIILAEAAHPDWACTFGSSMRLLAGVGNVDGYGLDQTLPASSVHEGSEECTTESTTKSTIIAIFNEGARIQRNFANYINVDPREICVSTVPGILNCKFDWTKFVMDTPTEGGLAALCQENQGQFVQSQVVTTCSTSQENKDGMTLQILSYNYPSCLGASCTTGQAEEFFLSSPNAFDMLEIPLQGEGYECASLVQTVFTPFYLPLEERGTSPTTAPIMVETDDDEIDTNITATIAPTTESDDDENGGTVELVTPSWTVAPRAEPKKSPAGTIIGVVAGVLVVGLLLLACYLKYRQRKKRLHTPIGEKGEDEDTKEGSDGMVGAARGGGVVDHFADEYLEEGVNDDHDGSASTASNDAVIELEEEKPDSSRAVIKTNQRDANTDDDDSSSSSEEDDWGEDNEQVEKETELDEAEDVESEDETTYDIRSKDGDEETAIEVESDAEYDEDEDETTEEEEDETFSDELDDVKSFWSESQV